MNFRWRTLRILSLLPALAIVGRLSYMQLWQHEAYAQTADRQSKAEDSLNSERGEIFATELDARGLSKLVPIAVNNSSITLYAEPKNIADPSSVARTLAGYINMEEKVIFDKIKRADDPYEELVRRGGPELVQLVNELKIEGIKYKEDEHRFYPNNNIGSHVLGFVQYKDGKIVGQYGIEGYLDKFLAGQSGLVSGEKTSTGAWLSASERELQPTVHGSDVVLTIDWTIQYHTCRALNDWVEAHGASAGTVIIMDPNNGAIISMCSAPDFNPNIFNEVKSVASFNNPAIFDAYEPGSIVKPLTMAAALDRKKITPSTTYEDTGEVRIEPHTIRNSDLKSNGVQNMTDVLVKSLNTGVIYAMRQIGGPALKNYFEAFGLGKETNIELAGESAGNIKSLSEKKEIYYATGSFGQGITATPLQMVNAYSAIANGGTLWQPHIIKEVIHPDGVIEATAPEVLGVPIEERAAAMVTGMLVEVVEKGHGKKAGVDGYYIAGKTGTAQIPRSDGQGYETGPGSTIGSFVGYGPVRSPRFAMIVRVDRPRDVVYAESSAAPLFGQIAKFLLQYYEIPPDKQL